MRYAKILCVLVGSFALTIKAWALPLVPDNGFGTAAIPIRLDYTSETQLHIVNGLPVGTQVNIDGVLKAPTAGAEVAGGTLGGTKATGQGATFNFDMHGSGSLLGYNRMVSIPLPDGIASFAPSYNIEQNAAPRILNAPVQSFDTDMFRLFGQYFPGDPDFDLLRITAGTDFGMPSPGHTTLTQSGGNWAVDSFFDITYRIDFVGHPGSPFGGMSGSTTGTVRISVPEPASLGMLFPAAMMMFARRGRRRPGTRTEKSPVGCL